MEGIGVIVGDPAGPPKGPNGVDDAVEEAVFVVKRLVFVMSSVSVTQLASVTVAFE